jgi:AsmA protein
LKALRANGSLRIGALQVNNLKAANVRADLKAGNGRIDVNPLAATLYQGTLQGAASVNAAPALPAIALKANLAGIQIAPLLKDLANNETLEGRGTVVLDVTTQGNTVSALKRALHGTGSLRLVDGAVKGIDIAGAIRNAKARLGALKGEQTQQADARQKTDFSELTATFNIASGIARNRDLSMKSPLLRVGGEGEINIGADTINYLVKASVVGTSKGQGGRDTDDLRGITVPVRVSGPLKAPSYKLDFGAMITDTARQKVEDAVKERLLERLGGGAKPGGDATPKDGAKSGGSARDALKGLFGR